MGTAVFGAPEFRARSGRMVRPQEDGSVRFELAHGYLDRGTAMDAEEFFQALRDEQLGRWRSPADPDLVLYVGPGDSVLVVDERTGDHQPFTRAEAYEIAGLAYRRAARAFFDVHPERKPWHDARHGEVWAVTETNGEALYRVPRLGRFEQVSGDDGLLSFPVSHVSIMAARRVWPEVAS